MRNGPKFPGESRSRNYENDRGLISKNDVLYRLFGELIEEIKYAFLNLHSETLDKLLEDYRKVYGDKAYAYALKTYPEWKSKRVKLSGQTMERLLSQVPPYLSTEVRYSLMMKLVRQTNFPVRNDKVIVNMSKTNEGLKNLEMRIDALDSVNAINDYPERLHEAALWLCNKDLDAAKAMLSHIDNDVFGGVRNEAKSEIRALQSAVQKGIASKPSYAISYPGVILSIIFSVAIPHGSRSVQTEVTTDSVAEKGPRPWVFMLIGIAIGFCIILVMKLLSNI